jgi:hypothetical protein
MASATDLHDDRGVLRKRILGALEALQAEHEWVSTEMVQKVIMMQHGVSYSLSRVGNNLRCLREHGVVEDETKHGTRHWKPTGQAYAPDTPKKLLISFPGSLHNMIVDFSRRGGLSKNAFVVNMVASGIQQLAAAQLGIMRRDPGVLKPTPTL